MLPPVLLTGPPRRPGPAGPHSHALNSSSGIRTAPHGGPLRRTAGKQPFWIILVTVDLWQPSSLATSPFRSRNGTLATRS